MSHSNPPEDLPFRIGLSTGAMYVLPLSLAFSLARRSGFCAVELVLGVEAIVRGPIAVERMARAEGVKITSIHAPILRVPGWPRDASRIGRMIEYARSMSPSPLLVLHVPHAVDLDSEERGIRYREELARWRSGAKEEGVRLAIETPGFFRESDRELALADPGRLAAFAAEEGTEVVLDTVHVASMSHDLLKAYRVVKPRLANVHLSDLGSMPRLFDTPALYSYYKHHQLPGDGHLNLAQFVRSLVADGYSGLLTLELSPVAIRLWSRRQTLSALAGALAFVQASGRAGQGGPD